jgi:hypothetical protein
MLMRPLNDEDTEDTDVVSVGLATCLQKPQAGSFGYSIHH